MSIALTTPMLVLAVVLTGCGSDSAATTTPETLTLSTSDQQAGGVVASTPAAISLGGLTPDLASAAIARLVPVVNLTVGAIAANAATIPIDRTTPCPAGGSAQSIGTLTGTLLGSGSGLLAAALTQTLTACSVAVNGRTLIITSAPTLTTSATYVVVTRVPADQQVMRVTGNTTVSVSGSRAPAVPCPVDLTLTTTRSTRSVSLTGTFCGAAVNQGYTWTP